MKNIILLSLFTIACGSKGIEQELTTVEKFSGADESIKSLDRTLTSMDQMISDMDRMNHNLDAIFRAVTECKTDAECDMLHEKYILEFEEKKNK